jgi:hypothetical protein
MVRKSKRLSSPKPSRKKLEGLYPSLARGPTPKERLAKLRAAAVERGIKPMTSEEFDRYIEEFKDVWPDNAEIDAFVAWIHKARRTGKYD